MRVKLFILMLCLACYTAVPAQKATLQRNSIVQAGLLEGEQGSAFQLQTINGLKYKTWQAGIGVGLDYYHTRSIPLFLDVRKAFGATHKAPFIYAKGGYNFPWLKEIDKQNFITSAKGGFYYDAGIGYELLAFKGEHLFFSAGYSGKNITTSQTTWIFIDYVYPGPSGAANYKQQYHYLLQRISITTGLRF